MKPSGMAKALARVVEAAADATATGTGTSPKSTAPRPPVPVRSVESQLVSLKLRGLSDSTTEAYRTDVRGYLAFAGERAPGDVSTLEAWKRHLLELGQRPATVNRKLTGVKRTLLEYARKHDSAGAEVLRGVYRDVQPVRLNLTEKHVSREKLLTEEEARRLLDGMPERVRLVAEFLFSTGARVSEALGVKLTDIRPVNGHSEVLVLGKGQKARTLLVRTELLERVQNTFHGLRYLFETRNGQPFSRTYIHREFIRASERELGKRVSPHCARHSFATWALTRTRKVKGVSEYLGHSDTSTTLNLYVHEKLSSEELLGGSL